MLAAGMAAGCASLPSSPALREGAAVELSQTPFFPQREYQCGPAALATSLGASGVTVTPDQLVPAVYLPGRQGSLQAELVAAARRHQRAAVAVEPQLPALITGLRDGQPVLVLLNLGLSWLPVWHYAVVVGYEPDAARFILRSGSERRATMRVARFDAAWARAKRWGVMVVPTDRIPRSVSERAWLSAVAPFESLRQFDQAQSAYAAAVQRWPQSAVAWIANGNVQALQQRWADALVSYGRAVALQDGVAVRNNRADLLGKLGCSTLAHVDLRRAAQLDPQQHYATALRQTALQLSAQDACPAFVHDIVGAH